MYLASFGELVLIASLWGMVYTLLKNNGLGSTQGALVMVALVFISITASIGVFRFAGVESVVAIHDLTSLLAKQFAMIIYAFGVLLLFAQGQYKKLGLNLFLLIFIVNLFAYLTQTQLPSLITDVFIFVAFVLLALSTKAYYQTAAALLVLLLVPVTELISSSVDLQMAVFHILLAAHFYLASRLVSQQAKLV